MIVFSRISFLPCISSANSTISHAAAKNSFISLQWVFLRWKVWVGGPNPYLCREEFLSAAESDTVCNKAKGIVLQASKTITLEGFKYALPLAVKALIPGVP